MPAATIAAPRHPREQAVEDVRARATSARSQAAAATTIPQLRTQVEELAAIVETLVDLVLPGGQP